MIDIDRYPLDIGWIEHLVFGSKVWGPGLLFDIFQDAYDLRSDSGQEK